MEGKGRKKGKRGFHVGLKKGKGFYLSSKYLQLSCSNRREREKKKEEGKKL